MSHITKVLSIVFLLALGLSYSEHAKAYWYAPADLVYDEANDAISGQAVTGHSYPWEGFGGYCAQYNDYWWDLCDVYVAFNVATVSASQLVDPEGVPATPNVAASYYLPSVSSVSRDNPDVFGIWTHNASHDLAPGVCVIYYGWFVDCWGFGVFTMASTSKSASATKSATPCIGNVVTDGTIADRPSWFQYGALSNVLVICLAEGNDKIGFTHIKQRHAFLANSNDAGHFESGILNSSTSQQTFYQELMLVMLTYSPSEVATFGSLIRIEQTLGSFIGTDRVGAPTNKWRTILIPVGDGVYQVLTSYPLDP